MRSRSLKAQANERKDKILLSLNAIGRKVKAQELAKEAVLNDLSTRQIGQYLKYLHKKKQVRFFPKEHMWAALKERAPREASVVSAEQEVPRVFIMIKPSENTLYLSLAGMKIPILIEE